MCAFLRAYVWDNLRTLQYGPLFSIFGNILSKLHLQLQTLIVYGPLELHIYGPLELHIYGPLELHIYGPLELHVYQPLELHIYGPLELHIYGPWSFTYMGL